MSGSTASLPAYVAPYLTRIPSYTAEPQEFEQRLAYANHRPRPSGSFVKQSKNGDVKLCLAAQENNIELPIYGSGAAVEGIIELSKTEGVTSVEVKVEARLRLQELAEGGATYAKLSLDNALLWVKDRNNSVCPSRHRFRLTLPSTFDWEGRTYPLPPTYEVELPGIPGFNASIEYSVSATVNKPNSIPMPLMKSSLFGINIGNTNVSTPFVYYPRTRSAVPLPIPLLPSRNGFQESPDWRLDESLIRCKKPGGQDILVKFYIPASRVFCMSQSIPFHLTLQSSAHSLAAFLPYGPMANFLGKRPMRVQVMRQATVDVRNEEIMGTKTDMWRVDCISEGLFRHTGDGSSWSSYTGDLIVDSSTKVTGFKAGGLTVKDFILLSMNPPDPKKSPFSELRLVVPIRLTTDPWSPDAVSSRLRAESGSSLPSPVQDPLRTGVPSSPRS